jgi:signal transduction histidine kinase
LADAASDDARSAPASVSWLARLLRRDQGSPAKGEWEALAEALGLGLALIENGKPRWVSSRFVQLFPEAANLSPLAALGANAPDLIDALARLGTSGEGFSHRARIGQKVLRVQGARVSQSGEPPLDALALTDETEAALRESLAEKRFAFQQARVTTLEEALDGLTQPVWIRKADLTLGWVNAAYAKALESERIAALEGQKEIAAVPLDHDGRTLARRAAGANIRSELQRHVVLGGSRRLLALQEAPLKGGGLVGQAHDITALEETRTELARHMAAHEEVLERLGTAVAIFGSDTRISFFNSAWASLWGLDERWLETKPSLDEVLEELRRLRQLPEQADFRRFKAGWLGWFRSLIEPYQELLYRPDGSTFRMLVIPHPLGGLLFTLEDVTSRLALESSYNTLIAVQRETLDNLTEAVAVFGSDGRLKLYNPTFLRLWNLEPEVVESEPHITELIDQLQSLLSPPGDLTWAVRRRALASRVLERLAEMDRLELTDGRIVEALFTPLPDGAVLTSFRDITDSVRIEQALRERNAALEAADNLKVDFLANVSYQLRTPLNAIIGFGEILDKGYFGALNERQKEYAQYLLDAGRQLVSLVDAILDLSTIEAGYMELEPRRFDVKRMLEKVQALTTEWVAKAALHFEVVCAPDVGEIEGDEKRLMQVLGNLISNAIKFTPQGGRIRVEAMRTVKGDGIVLQVQDTGEGIALEDQDRVLLPFERASSRSGRAGAGVGVGLALVKSFVELHGGTVEIQSTLDQGTTVTCRLPAKPPKLEGRTRTSLGAAARVLQGD